MGMKKLTVCLHGFAIAVFLISDYRMSDILHMYANLMGASGFETAFHKRIIFKALYHLKMRTGILGIVDVTAIF